jgi:hypothetical protein
VNTPDLTDYWQSALALIAIGSAAFRFIKKSRDDSRELERLRQVKAKQDSDGVAADARTIAADARNVADMRAQVIEEQARQIGRLERHVKRLEDERDGCREELVKVKDRLNELEGRR